MKKRTKILGGIFVLLVIAAAYGFYQYNRQPADIRKQAADMQINAIELAQAFMQDEESANRNYVGKVLLVTGKTIRIDYDSSGLATMQLDAGDPLVSVICSFYKDETPALKNIIPGATVQIKGICNGKLMDVVLNKCNMAK